MRSIQKSNLKIIILDFENVSKKPFEIINVLTLRNPDFQVFKRFLIIFDVFDTIQKSSIAIFAWFS